MEYRHVKRSGIAFVLLGVLTLGVYPVVVLSHIRKEVATLLDGKGVDSQTRFVWIYLLGFLTLGIAPLIWICRMANKIQMAALEKRITSPRLSGSFMFWWGYVGVLILVGPFVAYHRFFKLLNKVENAANSEASEKAKNESAKQELLQQVRNLGNEESTNKKPESPMGSQAPYPHLPEEGLKPGEAKVEPSWNEAAPATPSGAKWRVRTGKGEIRCFATKQEAVSFARSLLAQRRAEEQAKAKKE